MLLTARRRGLEQDVSDGLRRLQLQPRIKISEEDWRDMTLDGLMTSSNDTLTQKGFYEVMRNQVMRNQESGQFTVNLPPSTATLNPGLETRNPEPETRMPRLATLNSRRAVRGVLHPTPYTLHPTPYTPHLAPYTEYSTPSILITTPHTHTSHPAPHTLPAALRPRGHIQVRNKL